MGKGTKNFGPTTNVSNQENTSNEQNSSKTGVFTWQEVRQHSTKNDRWLVIDRSVYDVTRWQKHPGGQVVLNHYAGQDATVKSIMKNGNKFSIVLLSSFQEAFYSLHPDLKRVKKYFHTFYLGELIDGDEPLADRDRRLKEDFQQLKQTAIERVRSFSVG